MLLPDRTIHLATKTLARINEMLEADQGALYRHYLKQVLPHIGDAYRGEEDKFRTHLGASQIGGDCARALWYGFRWASFKRFEGRILRLFNRGHLEEGRVIALLLMIGCKVYQQDANGKQFTISAAGGHFGGSGDGVIEGLPDLAHGTFALFENKTHGDKSYKELVDKGVRNAKFEHYVQMQCYERKMELTVALYVGVNKNDDHLHMELVTLNSEVADQFIDRGEKLVFMEAPPKKLDESPGFWKCSWCDYKTVCHLNGIPEVNCRTCINSSPLPSGEWLCKLTGQFLNKRDQIVGCEEYKRLI